MRNRVIVAAALLVALAIPSLALAQSRTQSGTSSGLFGSRNLGGGLSGLSRGGSGGAAGGGLGGLGSGVGGGNLQGADASAGQLGGSERFVRGNRQAGDFVGADTGDLQSFVGGLAGGANSRARGGMGDLGALLGAAQRANQQGGGSDARGGRARRPVRTTRAVAFEYPAPPAAQLETRLTTRLTRTTGVKLLPGVEVQMQDRTAVLRGVAATPHDRDLAEQLVMLEAGVSRVQNELTVSPPEDPARAEEDPL